MLGLAPQESCKIAINTLILGIEATRARQKKGGYLKRERPGTGLTFSAKTGSVKNVTPPICIKVLAWPIHVAWIAFSTLRRLSISQLWIYSQQIMHLPWMKVHDDEWLYRYSIKICTLFSVAIGRWLTEEWFTGNRIWLQAQSRRIFLDSFNVRASRQVVDWCQVLDARLDTPAARLDCRCQTNSLSAVLLLFFQQSQIYPSHQGLHHNNNYSNMLHSRPAFESHPHVKCLHSSLAMLNMLYKQGL